MTTWDGQYSHPSEEEVNAILARAQIDLRLAEVGIEAAKERYRYRGIEPIQMYHHVAMVSAATVARVSSTTYAPSIHDLVAKGERLIDRTAFWSALPLVGEALMSWLADQLDRLTDRIEKGLPPRLDLS